MQSKESFNQYASLKENTIIFLGGLQKEAHLLSSSQTQAAAMCDWQPTRNRDIRDDHNMPQSL
jgi:hypothetical protein